MASRVVVPLAFFLSVLLVLSGWVASPASLLAQSSNDSPGDGLQFHISSVRIDDTRRPVVTYQITDDAGHPLALADLDGAPRFTLAWLHIDEETGLLSQWASYIVNTVAGQPYSKDGQEMQPVLASATQAGLDPTGTTVDQGGGIFTYTFTTVLPENFDRQAVHRVAGQASRGDDKWVGNPTLDFVPSGAPVVESKDLIETTACNQCHDPLEAHGGNRRDVKYCVTCHTSQTIDPETGNSVDFKQLIHKIHRGAELPSVMAGQPYFIVGFSQGVQDYSTVEFPQDIRNCAKCHGEAFPYDPIPSNGGCTSCHDHVNANTGVNHPAGAYADAECFLCHAPQGRDFDISLTGAHTIPQLSQQAPGVNFAIVAVKDAEDGEDRVNPGHHPQVIFNLKDNAGQAIDPSTLGSLQLTLSGPTTEFTLQDYNGNGVQTPFIQQDARHAVATGDGNYSVTFSLAVPQDATGTYAIGMEGYKCAALERLDQAKGGSNCTVGNTEFNEIRDAGASIVRYFAVTDAEPVPRRTVTDNTKCAACHDTFSKNFLVHGGTRNNPGEYCALCHNPSNDSLGRQPAPPAGETATTFSVNFNVLAHKIHAGSELTNPYLLFSPSGTATNVQEFLFPGDLRDCEKCHLSETNLLRPDMGLASMTHEIDAKKTVLNTFFTPPIKAACTSCHDGVTDLLGLPVGPHADMFTTNPNSPNAVEQCAECHGEGGLLAVSYVHAHD
jgi:OmcA/MtrC family decaheme c-type cytochrome